MHSILGENMAKIHFTYVRDDTEIAVSLAGFLRESGHDVQLSFDDIKIGNSFGQDIIGGIKSTDFLVVILSESAGKSKWFKNELSTIMGYYRERKKPIILPLVFDDERVVNEFEEVYKYYNVLICSRSNIHEFASRLSYRISSLIGELEAIKEENKENIAKVEKNAETYIAEAITRLTAKEKDYRNIAYGSYILCGIFLLGAIILLLYKANLVINSQKVLTTAEQIQLGLVGFVLLAVIISVARFLYLIGKSFMVESLRNSDRIHAISFGEFYLKAYGEKADWNEIKDAFQHWNIDGGSSFSSQSANDFDPEVFKNIIEFTKVITSKK